jgi:DnaJ-class molecular chaperone
MNICPRCNGTGEEPTCESCICHLCHGEGELLNNDKPFQKYQPPSRREYYEWKESDNYFKN